MGLRNASYLMIAVGWALAGSAQADEQPSATVTIDEVQVMLILGGDHGSGTLSYQGTETKFKASGLKLGGIGVHKMHMTGDVYQLDRVEDFDGLYFAAEAGATFVTKGGGGVWLKNDDGVVMHLKSENKGLALSLGVEGFDVSFEN